MYSESFPIDCVSRSRTTAVAGCEAARTQPYMLGFPGEGCKLLRTHLWQWSLIVVPCKHAEKSSVDNLKGPRHHLLSFPLTFSLLWGDGG